MGAPQSESLNSSELTGTRSLRERELPPQSEGSVGVDWVQTHALVGPCLVQGSTLN